MFDMSGLNDYFQSVFICVYIVVFLRPISVWAFDFSEELLDHPSRNGRLMDRNLCVCVAIFLKCLFQFLIFAVVVDFRRSTFNNVSDCVDPVAIYKNSRLLLAVEDEPQHERQKNVS